MRLHFLLTLMIFGVLVQSFVEATRLHLPTGANAKSAGAWSPEREAKPSTPASRPEFAAVTEPSPLN